MKTAILSFNRFFYKYVPLHVLFKDIEGDLKRIGKEIADMLVEVTE